MTNSYELKTSGLVYPMYFPDTAQAMTYTAWLHGPNAASIVAPSPQPPNALYWSDDHRTVLTCPDSPDRMHVYFTHAEEGVMPECWTTSTLRGFAQALEEVFKILPEGA